LVSFALCEEAGPVSAVAVREVSKLWGAVKAVDRVSFTAETGTLNVLLGPSGCGKSTTLRLIAGLEHADSGQVFIADRDVTNLPPAQRNIAMVFQSYALFPHLTVAENIVFGLRVRRTEPAEQDRRLKRVADLLGLAELLGRKPSQLSGGQQQRVALGRAIIAEAPVCLMDEPLSNLDAQLRAEMRQEIRGLQQKLGITMLYVTHDQIEAMSMADRVILMRSGRIEQDGAPDELYSTPATIFTARFIGTPPMNIVDLAPGAGGWVIDGTPGPVVIAGPTRPLALGVRPEDVRLSVGEGYEAKVQRVEYLGADSIVGCTLGASAFVARVPGKVALGPGDATRLAWARGAEHFFDRNTGARARLETEPARATLFA
jgi:sn-glycerol 3-phosphate transport system ATP-binding protein